MKIKGLIWGAALWAPIALNSSSLRAEEIDLTSLMEDSAASCDTCCDAGCCDGCDECCDDGCGEGCCDACGCFDPYWFAAAEFLFMGVDATGPKGNVYIERIGPGLDTGIFGEGYEDFTYAPRLSLGRQLSENWGIVGRFFYLSDEDDEAIGPLNLAAAPSQALASQMDARLYYIDVEGVRSIQGEVWKVDASAGVRHAGLDLENDFAGIAFPAPANIVAGTSSSSSSFEGTGLTTGLTGRRQLGASRASLFAGARGSLLWGDSDTSAVTTAIANEGALTAVDSDFLARAEDTEMFITELTVGVQWDFALRRIPANAFFRTAFEYQNWDVDGDVGSAVQSIAATPNNQATIAAEAGPADVDLYGLVIGTGFTW